MTTLEVKNLVIRKGAVLLLDAINFRANGGELIGVIGPNGAGKSTLLRAIAGLEKPASGAVLVNDAPFASAPPRERARILSYLPQSRDVHWAMTAETVASLGRFAYGAPHRQAPVDRAAVERALGACDALSFRDRIMTTLSGGEQARIHLARTFAAETPILIADEPTSALDLRHALSIAAMLRRKVDLGGLVVAAFHDLSLARQWCTRIIVLDAGTLVADGAPNETLSNELIERVFGVSMSDIGAATLFPAHPGESRDPS